MLIYFRWHKELDLVKRPAPNHVDIVRFRPKGALTALKRVYLVKRSLSIYSVRNILPYPMWDITIWAFTDNIYMVGCGLLQMVSEPIPDPGVGVCLALSGPAIPWDTTRTLCLHGGVFVMSHIG